MTTQINRINREFKKKHNIVVNNKNKDERINKNESVIEYAVKYTKKR